MKRIEVDQMQRNLVELTEKYNSAMQALSELGQADLGALQDATRDASEARKKFGVLSRAVVAYLEAIQIVEHSCNKGKDLSDARKKCKECAAREALELALV